MRSCLSALAVRDSYEGEKTATKEEQSDLNEKTHIKEYVLALCKDLNNEIKEDKIDAY